MAGENNSTRFALDPLVDVAMTLLGMGMLILLLNQYFLLVDHFSPEVSPLLFTLIGVLAVFVGFAGRKIRRGEFDLPRTLLIFEIGLPVLILILTTMHYPLVPRILALVLILGGFQMSYDLAKVSEELLFDFLGHKDKANWSHGWETEGLRLYDRHIIGFRRLQRQMFFLDGLLALSWIIRVQPDFFWVLSGIAILFLQFAFLGLAFYRKKQIFWAIQGYDVDAQVFKRLVSMVLAIALFFSIVAVVLPVHYNPIPWKKVGEVINSLFTPKSHKMMMMNFPGGQRKDQNPDAAKGRIEQAPTKLSWYEYILEMVIGLTVLAIIGLIVGFFLSFLKEEHYRRKGFFSFLLNFYKFFREMTSSCLRALRRKMHEVQGVLEKRREERSRARLHKMLDAQNGSDLLNWVPTNPREEIVKFFLEMMVLLKAQGVAKSIDQTLSEYSVMITKRFPELTSEIGLVQGLVEEALYSIHAITSEAASEMRQAVSTVQEKLPTLSQ